MRFLPTSTHAAIDYLWGVSLVAVPLVRGWPFGSPAFWIAIAFGCGAIAYSLFTDYELGVVRVIPVPIHLALDGLAGAALATMPLVVSLDPDARWTFVTFGLVSVVASLITRTAAPARSVGAS